MADIPEAAEAADAAPAAEEAEAMEAPRVSMEDKPFACELSPAQLDEIWAAATDDDAIGLVARCLRLPDDFDEDARTSIWVDMVYKWIDFCKVESLSTAKALTFLTIMASLHAHAVGASPPRSRDRRDCLAYASVSLAVRRGTAHFLCPASFAETKCTKVEATAVFADHMLAETKALAPSERYTLPEVKALTRFATHNYLQSIKLHQLVFTEEQMIRDSHVELFLQTPAAPPATADAVDPDSIAANGDAEPAAEAPAEAPAEGATDAPADGSDEAPAEAPAPEATPTLEDEALTAAIAATVSAQVAAVQQNMAAEYAAQEQQVLDRIAALEAQCAK